ncbi:hypothetical protein EJB05_47424, partial [Eragrostis curvula]
MVPAAALRVLPSMTTRGSWHHQHQVWCSSAAPQTPEGGQQPARRSANYLPSSWDYNALLSLKGRDGRHPRISQPQATPTPAPCSELDSFLHLPFIVFCGSPRPRRGPG